MCSCFNCKNESTDTFIVCEICENAFCGTCANVSATEARVFSLKSRSLLFLCIECKPTMYEKVSLAKQIILYKKIIDDKEIMISDKQKIIDILEGKNKNKKETDKHAGNLKEINKENPRGSKTKSKPEITNTKIYEREQRKLMQDIIDLANPETITLDSEASISEDPLKDVNLTNVQKQTINYSNDDGFNHSHDEDDKSRWKIQRNRKNRNKISRGKPNPGTPLGKLKVIQKLSWIFLSNFDAEMESNDILECIDEKYRNLCQCERLQTRYQRVASFKLGVPFYLKRTVGSLNFWPEGTKVDRFNFPRRNIIQESEDENFQNGPEKNQHV